MVTFNDIEHSDNGKSGRKHSDVAILGVPYDMGSTFHSGQRNAPYLVREAGDWEDMTHHSANIDPLTELVVVDVGDVVITPGDAEGSLSNIKDTARSMKQNSRCLLSIGGDHSASAKLLGGVVQAAGTPVTLFHFDAQGDYWKHDVGAEMNHATWVRRVIDDGLVNRVVQFGVRGWGTSMTDRRWAHKNDIVSYSPMQDWRNALREELADTADPIYLSIDLNALDPAFCPGVSRQEPGGFSVRELFQSISAVTGTGKVIGADVMECIPDRDPTGVTVKVANRIVAQMLTGLATKGKSEKQMSTVR